MRRLPLLMSIVAVAGLVAATTTSVWAQTPPAFQATTSLVGDVTPHADPTVTLPAHATDDILYLMAMVRDVDDTASITVATGWAAVTGFPIDQNTAARYWLWWKRAASASETNPVIDFSGTTGDMYYSVHTYRGAITSETPHEVLGTATGGTADPASLTGITSLTAQSLIVVALTGQDNNNGPTPGCTTTGTDPAAYTERYVEVATGDDAMTCFSEGVRTAAGATGTVSLDFDTAVPVGWGAILMAIKPPVSVNQDGPAAVALAISPAVTTPMGRQAPAAQSLGMSPAVATPLGRNAPAAQSLAFSCPVCIDVNYPLNVTMTISPGVAAARGAVGSPAVSLAISPVVASLAALNASAPVALGIGPSVTTPIGRDVPIAASMGVSPAVTGLAGKLAAVDVAMNLSPAVGTQRAMNAAPAEAINISPAVSTTFGGQRAPAATLAMNVGATAVVGGGAVRKRSVTVIMVPV